MIEPIILCKPAVEIFNIWLYRLIDPFTKEICYIGQTEDPYRRLKQHCSKPGNIKQRNVYLSVWFLDLSKHNAVPVMEVFEACGMWDAREREMTLITEYWKSGHPLLNGGLKRRFNDWENRLNNAKFAQQRGTFNIYKVY